MQGGDAGHQCRPLSGWACLGRVGVCAIYVLTIYQTYNRRGSKGFIFSQFSLLTNILTSVLLGINAVVPSGQVVQLTLLGMVMVVDVFSALVYWHISTLYRKNYVPFNVNLIIER